MMNSHRGGGRSNKSGGGYSDKKYGKPSFKKPSFGKGGFGGRDSGRPTMHRATCSECGNPCEVPFKPSSHKPVFCNDCFKKSNGSAPRRSESRDYAPREYSNALVPGNNKSAPSKDQFEILNAKLDRIIRALEL